MGRLISFLFFPALFLLNSLSAEVNDRLTLLPGQPPPEVISSSLSAEAHVRHTTSSVDGDATLTVYSHDAANNSFPSGYFISPVEFPLSLSANFGELRTNAFHAGIDIRTGGVTGRRVLAAAEGHVYRILVSPVGYGRALYIEHPNGLATVYAHLDRFTVEIEAYIREQQYRRQSFHVDLTPPRGMFRFEQGELIGYSGNTGSSFGPHLHFEIREAATQMPVNPLLFDFDVKDNLPPVLYTLAVYPLTHNSLVNGRNEPLFIPLDGGRGRYHLPSGTSIEVYGEIGFGIEATDFLNNAPNRCGVWSVELLLDNKSVYRHELTRFAFGELRYINSHIDYAEKIRNRRDIQRTFLQPNNRMSIYGHHVNRGIGLFYNEGTTGGRIVVKDAYKNRSVVDFSVRTVMPEEEALPPKPPGNFVMLMRYDQPNRYSGDNVSVSLPAGALYDDLLFGLHASPPVNGSLTPVYHIHDEFTPVHRNYQLSIGADKIPPELREKALIVNLNNNNSPSPVGSRWNDGYVSGQTNVFGRFTVMVDTIPPVIEPLNIAPGRDMSNRPMISFRVRDDLSGIATYNGYIDGEWALFEFDPKNDHLFYVFDKKRIGQGKNRELELIVADEKENISVYNVEFYY
ncbi:MAG: M23 family metallopeptidase [Marinilabiliales bacterium]|nr:MAG: M23 family metallopeptidase [Marinilabiliales bacterium]